MSYDDAPDDRKHYPLERVKAGAKVTSAHHTVIDPDLHTRLRIFAAQKGVYVRNAMEYAIDQCLRKEGY